LFQDVACLRVNDSVGDISLLGHVDHRIVCTPDFETLLDSTWTTKVCDTSVWRCCKFKAINQPSNLKPYQMFWWSG